MKNDRSPRADEEKSFANLAELAAWACSPPESSQVPKKELPLWSPALFRDGYRKLVNVEEVTVLGFDVDEDPIPSAAEMRAHVAALATEAFVHSSSSSTKTAPRWRLFLGLSRALSPVEYGVLWRAVAAQLPFKVGQGSKDASRGWYAPRYGPDGYFAWWCEDAPPLDVDAVLDAVALQVSPKPTGPRPEHLQSLENISDVRVEGAAALLGRAWPKRGRHIAQFALAGALYRAQWPKERALEFLCKTCREAGNEERAKRIKTIERTWAIGDHDGMMTGWPTLGSYIDPDVVAAARKLLTPRDLDRARHALAEQTAALPRFPLHCLPDVLKRFAEEQAAFTQVSVDLPALLAVGVCSAAIAGKVDVEVSPGYVEPLNLYVLVALPSGERKSPNFDAALAPLREIETELEGAAKAAQSQRKAKKDALVKRRSRLQTEYAALDEGDLSLSRASGALKPGGATLLKQIEDLTEQIESLEDAVGAKLMVEDVTPEAIPQALVAGGGRILIASDESGVFDNVSGRYAKDGRSNFDIILKGYSRSAYKVDRVNPERPSMSIPKPVITMLLSPQPSVVQQLQSPSMRSKGLLARFLYSFPESLVGRRAPETSPPAPETLRAYEVLIRRLAMVPSVAELAKRVSPNADIDEQVLTRNAAAGVAPRLTLSPGAAALHLAFRASVEARLRPEGDLSAMVDWGSKLPGQVARLAGVLHCAEVGPEGEVSEQTMSGAIEIAGYLIDHARFAYNCVNEGTDDRKVEKMWQWILSLDSPTVTRRYMQRRGPGPLRPSSELDPIIDALLDDGRLVTKGRKYEVVR